MNTPLDWYLSVLTRHHRVLIAVMILATVLIGSGITAVDGDLQIVEFESDSAAVEQSEYIEERFLTDSGTVTLVVIQDEDVITTDSFTESLALQAEIRANETVNATLSSDRPTADSASVFVDSELRSLGSFGATLEDKQRTFRTYDEDELTERFPETIADEQPLFGPGTTPETLLPSDHDGSASADMRLLIVVHETSDSAALLDSQLAIEELATEQLESDSFTFGEALVEERASEATATAFSGLGPLASVLLVVLLLVLYRDFLDAMIAVVGIAVVLLWTGSIVGWTGIELTQLLVAVPWLVLGLAIDYGLHVVMRYREAIDAGERPPAQAMAVGLAGVLVAITITSLTTAAGFLSGIFGPATIREFGIVTAAGIGSALVVFGVLVPALKLEFAGTGSSGYGKRPLGTNPVVNRIVSLGVVGAKRAPVVVLILAVVVAGFGAYGATQVETSTDRTDFFPGEPPAWAEHIPGLGLDSEAVTLQEQGTILDERFELIDGSEQVEFLIRGSVANESGASAIQQIETEANESQWLRAGNQTVFTPLAVVERFAEFDSDTETALNEADTTGDGIPDGNLTAAFDRTAELDADALQAVVAQTDGEYDAMRIVVPIQSGADTQAVAAEMRAIADKVDEPGLTVTATGGPIVMADREQALLTTLTQSFGIALVVTGLLLVVLFWLQYRRVGVGLITLIPVLVALSGLLGTMALLSIPYNAETAIITGIAIGLGVDYAIHVSARFQQERQNATVSDAIETAVIQTGGTLFASAVTTIAALAVLVATFIPSLQRFGIVMILVVAYAFLTAVFLLPSVLVLYERWKK